MKRPTLFTPIECRRIDKMGSKNQRRADAYPSDQSWAIMALLLLTLLAMLCFG